MSLFEQKTRAISRPTLEAVARTLVRWKVSPNWVTYTGLLITTGVAVLAGLGEIRWAGVAYIVAAVFDALDGTVARVSGKGSRFGAFLDSTIDRVEESIVFVGLATYYARLGGRWEIPLILVAAIGSLMVSYTRARAESLDVACKVGFMERPLRVVIMIAGMILNQMLITLIVLAVTSLFTTVQRIVHVRKMTGGERGGWGPVKEPFSPPVPAVAPVEGDEVL